MGGNEVYNQTASSQRCKVIMVIWTKAFRLCGLWVLDRAHENHSKNTNTKLFEKMGGPSISIVLPNYRSCHPHHPGPQSKSFRLLHSSHQGCRWNHLKAMPSHAITTVVYPSVTVAATSTWGTYKPTTDKMEPTNPNANTFEKLHMSK